jgi:GntR family transcriptional regulator
VALAKYEIILQQLSAEIDHMQPGEQILTEEQLAERFGVSAMTVRRALQRLADAKRVVGIPGKGTFVARRTVTKRMTLASFTESMRSAGMQASTVLISATLERSDAETAEQLEIEEGEQVFRLKRLRFGDSTPLCLEHNALRAARFPGLLGLDLTGSLYELLHRKYSTALQRSESRISATLPRPDEAKLLEISVEQPCIAVRSKNTSTDGETMESTVSLYRGDRYELLVESLQATELPQANRRRR